jgi:peptidoglycan/xylan/chitin deacetylase (PgdA/CDA1 family)/uncharacterized caspase-like protein
MSPKTIVAIGLGSILLSALVWAFRPNAVKPTEQETPKVSSETAPEPVPEPVPPLPANLEQIVARYRKTIVLLDDDSSSSDQDKKRTSLVGRIIFQENRHAITVLSEELTGEIAAADFSSPPPKVTKFLDLIEGQQELHDADKLSFREVFADIAESLAAVKSNNTARTELQRRVDDDRKALAEIQSLYEKELDKIFNRFNTRGIEVHREAWERYVAYLRTKYKREDILKEYESQATRIHTVSKQAAAHRDNDLEMYGTTLPAKTLVLTFDDGPHARYTDRILEVLKKNQVKAVFFTVGENLGTLKDGKIKPARSATAATHVLEAGSAIGSHTLSHANLPKLSDREVAAEIEQNNRLIEGVLKIRTPLFRPPYGETDPKVMAAVEAHKMKSVLWSIDSEDWADPVAKSIANRVIGEAKKLNRGIILMHDIHERTIEAVPLIIETLRADGFRFLTWNGEGFIDEKIPVTQAAPTAAPPIYRDSWAVVVGIDDYQKWPKLSYAVNDANGIKEMLTSKFGFKPDHVFTLLNADATRVKILSVLGDTLGNPKKVQREDRVFVFFAGHGATRKLPSGRDLGYIIPVDADLENFQGQSISMTNFQDISEAIPAKHVFFLMDSCYSGLALTRGVATGNYIKEVARRTARQMLTAGGANEEVADNGPNGHSIFTWTVLQGLEGKADLNLDGFISGSELASFVAPSVSGLSHQTPAFGNLPGNEGGEFLFELHPEVEFLSSLSTQLDQEAIDINAELDRVRKENQQLKDQLATVQATKAKETAGQHLNQGMSYYKEQRYQQALDEYLLAAKLDPASAAAANNVGFVYHKMNKLDDAVKWLQKTVTIDPKRSIAYANLGDALYEFRRMDEARRAYEKFLELSPNSSYAPAVRQRLINF